MVAPSVQPTIVVPSPAASPIVVTPSPTPSASPSPTPSASPTPSPSPSISPSPKPSVTPSPLSRMDDLLTHFATTQGAQPGCGGQKGCWQVADTQWRTIAQQLEQQIQTQGYQLTEVDLEDDTGLRVYQVSQNGVPRYYLNFLSTDQGTVYLTHPTLLSRKELEQAASGLRSAN